MLPPKAIEEFKEIYKQEFGEDLSDKEALEKATRVINLFQVIYKPIPKKRGRRRSNEHKEL